MDVSMRKNDVIKVIAMVSMFLDHFGYYLIPHSNTSNIVFSVGSIDLILNYGSIYYLLRIVGRIAFPIFAYYIAVGFTRTNNLKKYIIRVGIFAIITQVPFYFFTQKIFYLNVMFTFFLALIMLYYYEKNSVLSIVFILLAEYLQVDYGAYGIMTVLIFYVFRENKVKLLASFFFITLAYSLSDAYFEGKYSIDAFIQMFSVLSVPVIYKEYKKKIILQRYSAYLFYPVHISILVLIKKIFF